MAVAISMVLSGRTNRAAFSATSGMALTLEQITGMPKLIASIIGIPKPSNKLG